MIDNMTLNYSMIDIQSLVVGGIDTKDYPDFCDAYFREGFYLDGTELPDDILEELSNNHELVHQKVFDHIY
jgi:predicted NAD/FAD-binding protein